ncbi:ADP compounds hydrolase NudE [Xenorhabdus sp. Flor]|uniref:ADP compounds hydrolase NudE n=1 Tax=Xenorhabdus cabanillasii TaxID=351673 RepID=UPI001988456E|nr:ADP compounds hydrolase NudE [Xenorhabdus sp. Flor]MBD2814803.1 ADP compounds hydrolase NudE [Xenorhabdus sp. Flor]
MIDLKKPKILNISDIAHSRLFNIQSVDLEFSNGARRIYERMKPTNHEAVLIIPVIGDELLLIREYAVGIEQYELGFPKGAIDAGESILEAANRELKEEVGLGAKKLELLTKLTMAPSYFSSKMNIVIAQDLYPENLEGDEPEPLVQVCWPISDMMSLLEHPDFNEARNISALFFAQRYLNEKR